jgi:hypothetical protein
MQAFIDDIPIGEWGVLGWIGTVLVVAGVFCLEAQPNADGLEAVVDEDDKANYVNAEEMPVKDSWTESQSYRALEQLGVYFTCGRRKI